MGTSLADPLRRRVVTKTRCPHASALQINKILQCEVKQILPVSLLYDQSFYKGEGRGRAGDAP